MEIVRACYSVSKLKSNHGERRMGFSVEDRVSVHPIDYRTHKEDTEHIHYGRTGRVIDTNERMGQVCVAMDVFPECHNRDIANRFWYNEEELRAVPN